MAKGRIDYPDSHFQDTKSVYVDVVHGSLLMVDAVNVGSADMMKKYFSTTEEEIRLIGFQTQYVLFYVRLIGMKHSASISKSFQSAATTDTITKNTFILSAGKAIAQGFFQAILMANSLTFVKWF